MVRVLLRVSSMMSLRVSSICRTCAHDAGEVVLERRRATGVQQEAEFVKRECRAHIPDQR
jgi:hypothetical protein